MLHENNAYIKMDINISVFIDRFENRFIHLMKSDTYHTHTSASEPLQESNNITTIMRLSMIQYVFHFL